MAEAPAASRSADSDQYLTAKRGVIENDPSTTTSSLRQQMSQVDGGAGLEKHKIGHRRVDLDGKVTYKKTPTSELMAAIQLGIGQSITSMALKPKRDLLLQDFAIVETVQFPRDGSSQTPAHDYADFKFRTYAPVAFRYFKELFGIPMDAFLVSVCNNALKELSNPGASGSIFYLTHDDEFIIKTVQHKEAEFLQKLLPGYYMNLNQNPRTLLPKFYGLYCYQSGNKNIRFVVMNNLLPTSICFHEKYDLKGSTYKRKASQAEVAKSSPTLKDLDFREIHPGGILLEEETCTALLKTVDRDVRVLQSFQIMDYSMLLAVHNIDQAEREKAETSPELANVSLAGRPATGTLSRLQRNEPGRAKSVHQRLAHFSTAMEAIQARADPLEIDEDSIPPGGVPARNAKGERLLLYIGIIDILQSYRLTKKLEHAMKSVVHDADSISVHRPGFYAQRFYDFFTKTVFQKIPSLDEPRMKGNRFKKIVQIVRIVTDHTLKSGQNKAQTGDEEEREGRGDQSRSKPADNARGGMRDRPDVLPDTTPPQTLTSGSLGSLHDVYKQLQQQHQINLQQQQQLGTGSLGREQSHSDEHLSSVHSYALSTPTHTEFTEGIPSYTASSPSVSSDILGTPAHQPYTRSSNLPTPHATDSNDVFVQLHSSDHDSGSPYFVSKHSGPVLSSHSSPDHVLHSTGGAALTAASITTRL